MKEEEKRTEQKSNKNELEKFIENHKEFFDKYKRISEAVEEEMEEIAKYKAQHPEANDLEYQLKVTNDFLAEHPDVKAVELKVKKEN